jgi:predicted ribosome quality control (RQC) complex YloA/Tae2 family protein
VPTEIQEVITNLNNIDLLDTEAIETIVEDISQDTTQVSEYNDPHLNKKEKRMERVLRSLLTRISRLKNQSNVYVEAKPDSEEESDLDPDD